MFYTQQNPSAGAASPASGPVLIPSDINGRTLEEHLALYAKLGWRVQPCAPWDSAGKDPGKAPLWTLEQRLRATPSEVIRHFREHPTHNLGLVPTVPNLALDMDDPDTASKGIRKVRELFPELFNGVFVRARRGPHFHFACPDAPPGLHKLVIEDFRGMGVKLELFLSASTNIVLPPSVHPSSTPGHLVQYRWWNHGKIPVIPCASLVHMFGFNFSSNGAGTASRTGAAKADWAWLRQYRIDFRTLDFVRCWQLLGRYGRAIDDAGNTRVRHSVQCPWIDKHTDTGREWTPENSSTVIFVEDGQYPEFHCSHTTFCSDCGLKEVVEWMESVRPGILEECSTHNYQPGSFGATAHSPSPDATGAQVGTEQPPCPYDKVNWEEVRAKVAINPAAAGRFVQKTIYPGDSILHAYLEEARSCCESDDIYLLGSILPVCARLLARRVYAEWGMEKLYPNLFELLIGTAGMRKTSAVRCAKRVVRNCLPPEAFLSPKQSVEALFAEYCVDEGGCPDKVLLVEEGNALMATWVKSEYGARVAAEFLQLYDCAELTECFMRNKSKTSGPKRTVPETSTSVVIGGTFSVATFPLAQVKEGMARRFMYSVAETLGRTIHWPERLPSFTIADLFKPLLNLSGEIYMPRQGQVWDCWVACQDKNRKDINEVGADNEVLAARLTSAPSQVLKVAMNYEACRTVHTGWPILNEFTLAGLESAIGFVEEHLRAAAFLDQYGARKDAQEQAEVVLATVRRDFKAQRPDTIYVSRTDLTRKFCMHTGRHGAMTVEALYMRVLPELERQGEVARVVKRGKYEVYAFRTELGA
jgi:hypothetical protein